MEEVHQGDRPEGRLGGRSEDQLLEYLIGQAIGLQWELVGLMEAGHRLGERRCQLEVSRERFSS